jgi:dihydrofolate reductase
VFEWVYGNLVEETGAVIMGRRSYDNSIEAWEGRVRWARSRASSSPTGRRRARTPYSRSSPTGSSVPSRRPKEVAADKRIGLMGANIDQQFLAAGLVDEIRIHLINVLLGGGRRLFDQLPRRIELEQTGLSQTDGVTHLEYRVLRRSQLVATGGNSAHAETA